MIFDQEYMINKQLNLEFQTKYILNLCSMHFYSPKVMARAILFQYIDQNYRGNVGWSTFPKINLIFTKVLKKGLHIEVTNEKSLKQKFWEEVLQFQQSGTTYFAGKNRPPAVGWQRMMSLQLSFQARSHL